MCQKMMKRDRSQPPCAIERDEEEEQAARGDSGREGDEDPDVDFEKGHEVVELTEDDERPSPQLIQAASDKLEEQSGFLKKVRPEHRNLSALPDENAILQTRLLEAEKYEVCVRLHEKLWQLAEKYVDEQGELRVSVDNTPADFTQDENSFRSFQSQLHQIEK